MMIVFARSLYSVAVLLLDRSVRCATAPQPFAEKQAMLLRAPMRAPMLLPAAVAALIAGLSDCGGQLLLVSAAPQPQPQSPPPPPPTSNRWTDYGGGASGTGDDDALLLLIETYPRDPHFYISDAIKGDRSSMAYIHQFDTVHLVVPRDDSGRAIYNVFAYDPQRTRGDVCSSQQPSDAYIFTTSSAARRSDVVPGNLVYSHTFLDRRSAVLVANVSLIPSDSNALSPPVCMRLDITVGPPKNDPRVNTKFLVNTYLDDVSFHFHPDVVRDPTRPQTASITVGDTLTFRIPLRYSQSDHAHDVLRSADTKSCTEIQPDDLNIDTRLPAVIARRQFPLDLDTFLALSSSSSSQPVNRMVIPPRVQLVWHQDYSFTFPYPGTFFIFSPTTEIINDMLVTDCQRGMVATIVVDPPSNQDKFTVLTFKNSYRYFFSGLIDPKRDGHATITSGDTLKFVLPTSPNSDGPPRHIHEVQSIAGPGECRFLSSFVDSSSMVASSSVDVTYTYLFDLPGVAYIGSPTRDPGSSIGVAATAVKTECDGGMWATVNVLPMTPAPSFDFETKFDVMTFVGPYDDSHVRAFHFSPEIASEGGGGITVGDTLRFHLPVDVDGVHLHDVVSERLGAQQCTPETVNPYIDSRQSMTGATAGIRLRLSESSRVAAGYYVYEKTFDREGKFVVMSPSAMVVYGRTVVDCGGMRATIVVRPKPTTSSSVSSPKTTTSTFASSDSSDTSSSSSSSAPPLESPQSSDPPPENINASARPTSGSRATTTRSLGGTPSRSPALLPVVIPTTTALRRTAKTTLSVTRTMAAAMPTSSGGKRKGFFDDVPSASPRSPANLTEYSDDWANSGAMRGDDQWRAMVLACVAVVVVTLVSVP